MVGAELRLSRVRRSLPDPLALAGLGYTQVTDPSAAFDSAGNFYILTLQTSGLSQATGVSADGAMELMKFNFSGSSPSSVSLPNSGIVYQWVTGSDAATSPALAVDSGTVPFGTAPPAGVPVDPYANNVYIAWASIDVKPAATPAGIPFNPDRAEVVVGTPIASPSSDESSLAFSGVTTVNLGGNFSTQIDTHPTLVINPGNTTNSDHTSVDPGQITIGWVDAGTGATVSPPVSLLMSQVIQPGKSYGFDGNTGVAAPAVSLSGTSTQGLWTLEPLYDAGPNPGVAADPVSVAVGDVNSDSLPDIVVTDKAPQNSSDSGMGVLLNQGGGAYPAAGVTAAELYSAGLDPSSVALQDLIAGHTTNTIPDAAIANDSTAGGVTLLANGSAPNDGKGIFSNAGTLNESPQGGTSGVVADHFDGTSAFSLVAINSSTDSIEWFPDASMTNAGSLATAFSPIAIVSGNFRGGSAPPDIAVLYSNGDIQFFTNTSNGSAGNMGFVAGQLITGTGAVAMAAGRLDGGLSDLVIADSTGDVSWLQNTWVTNSFSISFNPSPNFIYTVPGTPVAIATGQLSTGGNPVAFQDIAVAYRAPANSINPKPNESMVAVFQNMNGVFAHTTVPGTGADFDAGDTFPTAIALGYLSGNAKAPWEDIIVTNNENDAGRGTISVLQVTTLPTTSTVTPTTTSFSDIVSVPNPGAVDNLTVNVALFDAQGVGNLKLVLQGRTTVPRSRSWRMQTLLVGRQSCLHKVLPATSSGWIFRQTITEPSRERSSTTTRPEIFSTPAPLPRRRTRIVPSATSASSGPNRPVVRRWRHLSAVSVAVTSTAPGI